MTFATLYVAHTFLLQPSQAESVREAEPELL